jgi:hypothetical protein
MNSSGSIHSAWSRVQKRKHGRGGVERNGMATTESGDQHSVNHEMGTGLKLQRGQRNLIADKVFFIQFFTVF